jgi:hypothetical protein
MALRIFLLILFSRKFLYTAVTVDACGLTIILPSLSLKNMTYCTTDTKATAALVLGVVVDFWIDVDLSSPQRSETFS